MPRRDTSGHVFRTTLFNVPDTRERFVQTVAQKDVFGPFFRTQTIAEIIEEIL